MTQDRNPEREETAAQRKARLVQQCREYRAGIGRSRTIVRSHLGVDGLAKTAVGLVSSRAQSALINFSDMFDLKSISGAKLQRMLPLLVSGVSLLTRRSLWKPMLRGAVAVGTVAATVYFFSRKEKKAKTEHVALHEHL